MGVDPTHGVSPDRVFYADLIGWGGVLVPIVLVFVTALIRSIVKRNKFFSGENLYLGIDLAFAGLAAALVESLELMRDHLLGAEESQFTKVVVGFVLSFCCAIALLVVTKLHQTYDGQPPQSLITGRVLAERDQKRIDRKYRNRRRFMLGVASNLLGFATIGVFAWLRARKLV